MRVEPVDAGRVEDAPLRHHLTMIENVTGVRPSTCPWGSFYEPIVREVMSVAWAIHDGNLAAAIGTDPPLKLAQACGVYERALKATQNEERALLMEEAAAERRAKAAARKARG